MKKTLTFLACMAMVFASCKKDANELAQPKPSTLSTNEQVADLIKRADKNLYDQVYGPHSDRDMVPGKDYIRGYFRIPGQTPEGGNVDNGYCVDVDRVCVVIVSAGTDPGSGSTEALNENVDLTYSEADNARLIINTPHPVVRKITSFSSKSNTNGGVNISFKEL